MNYAKLVGKTYNVLFPKAGFQAVVVETSNPNFQKLVAYGRMGEKASWTHKAYKTKDAV